MIKRLLLILLALPSLVMGTEFSPWLGRDFEIEPRATYIYQTYSHINTGHGKIRESSHDQFYTLSAMVSAFDYSAEIETTIANTRVQRPACDNIRLTARYRLMDDILGIDPVTVTPGITLTKAFKHSVKDVSSFHHGEIEGEFNLAIGREISCLAFWEARWWGVLGIGGGDHGWPWIRADLFWEHNFWDLHQCRICMKTLWGLGHKDISRHESFGGYGPIRHRSVDLGVRYTYHFEFGGVFSLEYNRRVYARNFPTQANLIFVSFVYPFSL